MELALYCPVYGYYEAEKDIGRAGDFFTSVSVGELFGELLAFQFADWFEASPTARARPQIVEAGAHHGQLAKDILTALRRKRTTLFDQLQYYIVEPSPRRLAQQKKTLDEFTTKVRWVGRLDEFAGQGGIFGIIFSNELLDALPVHRMGWDAAQRKWFEWGVALQSDRFVAQRIQHPPANNLSPELPAELLNVLPDGFTTELCPAAQEWWTAAANTLSEGRLLTIDYGLEAEDFFLPARKNGTLRAYYRHHLAADPLVNVGEQDLTAHINFTTLRSAGESAGLKTETLTSQEKFLTQIARQTWERPADFDEWTPARTRQFQTLTHPEHLGRSFGALVQSRRG